MKIIQLEIDGSRVSKKTEQLIKPIKLKKLKNHKKF